MANNSSIKRILFSLVICCPILSCQQSYESALFNEQSELRIIERQDHQKCISKGLDFGEWDDMTTELYWRCRYDLAQARFVNFAIMPGSVRHNVMIDRISDEILKNLSRAKFAVIARIDDDIELSDHKKCVDSNSKKMANNDEYYLCRQKLILARIPPAPKITNSFETSILPDARAQEYLGLAQDVRSKTNEEIANSIKLMKQYPGCAGLNTKSDDFKKCAAAADESKACLAKVDSMKIKKELEDKIYCQKQAFVQFPDNYAIAKDKSASEIARIEEMDDEDNENGVSDYLNDNKTNIGRNAEESGDKQDTEKDRLYSKMELLRLRERFINQCNKTMDEKLPDFVEQYNKSCAAIASNWGE